MNEFLMILIMAVCGSLFALGGTGWKPARRYGIPLFLFVVALFCHVLWWKAFCMALSLMAGLSLGYGERTPYWLKAIVFATYGASFLWLGFSWWIIITPIICFSLFVLSNLKLTANTFFWKACEFLYGVLIGITFISCINTIL